MFSSKWSNYFQISKTYELNTQVLQYGKMSRIELSLYFAWKIPWMEEPGRLQSMGSLESDTTERLHFHFSLSCIGEENGNPLQHSCLENPRDGGAWWLPSMGSHRVGHDWSDLAAAGKISYSYYPFIVKVYNLEHWFSNCILLYTREVYDGDFSLLT